MEIKKPNDIFVLSTVDNFDVFDLAKSEITPENTSLFSKEEYRNTDFAKKAFTSPDGQFNEELFSATYNKAADLFTELSNDEFLTNSLQWDEYDLFRPEGSEVYKPTVSIEKDRNPFKNTYGRSSLTSVDLGDLSVRELAQKSKIYDVEKKKFIDKTPNDLGLLGSLFNKTLVYAQYDEDGYHEDEESGRTVMHKKGEYKLNPDGDFYTEFLGDREVGTKQIVNPSDLITTDGSVFNSIDFWDSDGLDKSVVGTTFKLASEIAPYLIPGVNVAYGGIKMALGLAKVLPTFYKAFEGIIAGESQSGLWKNANKFEGFMAKYGASSYSDNASDSMFNYEQLGSLVTQIFSQIYEQRAAATLSTLFYKVNNPKYLQTLQQNIVSQAINVGKTEDEIVKLAGAAYSKLPMVAELNKKRSQLAKSLSLGYMALTQTGDMYQTALNGGYDRRTAGIAAVLSAGGMYALMMNNKMGDWFLDEATGYKTIADKRAIIKAVNPHLEEISNAVKKIETKDISGGKKALATAIGKVKNSIHRLLKDTDAVDSMAKNSVIEGVEEVTEEVAQDAVKGVVDVMSWLGFPAISKEGSFNTLQNIFSPSGLERYITAAIGGAIGGGMFELNRLKIEPLFDKSLRDKSTENSLLHLIANGKTNDILKVIDEKSEQLGNNFLSPILSNVDGKEMYLIDEKYTQAKAISDALKLSVQYYDSILNAEGLKVGDEDVIKKAMLDQILITDLEKGNIHKFVIADYTDKISNIVNLNGELKGLDEKSEKFTEVTEQLKAAREDIKSFLNGEQAAEYIGRARFALSNLHTAFANLNVADYARTKYSVDYNTLPQIGGTLSKESLDKEFAEIADNPDDKRNQIKRLYQIWDTMNKRYSGMLKKYGETDSLETRKKYNSILSELHIIKNEDIKDFQESLDRNKLPKYSLSDSYNVNIADALKQLGYELSPEQEEVLQITVPFNEINELYINEILKSLGKEDIKPLPNKTHIATILPLDLAFLTSQIDEGELITTEIKESLENGFNRELKKLKSSFTFDEEEDEYGTETLDAVERISEVSPYTTIYSIVNSYRTKLAEATTPDEFMSVLSNLKGEVLALPTEWKAEELLDKVTRVSNNVYFRTDNNNKIGNLLFDNNNTKILSKTDKLLKNEVVDNYLFDLLNQMNVEVFNNGSLVKTNIIEYLKSELSTFEMVPDAADYVRSQDTIDEMKQALQIIEIVKSINSAMLQSEITPTNPYGFNVGMKKSLTALGKSELAAQYETISPEAYNLLNQELGSLEQKFNYLIELAQKNLNSILTRQEKTKDKTIELILKELTNTTSLISLQNMKVKGVPIVPSDELNKILGTTRTNEEKLLDISETLYNNFQTEISKSGTKEVLDELFENFGSREIITQLFVSEDMGLTENSEAIEPIDYYSFLHSILAINFKSFYKDYKSILEKELNLPDNKAPFFVQELGIMMATSSIINPEVTSHVMQFMEDKKSNLGDRNGKALLKYVFIVPGTGGAGKTSVVANIIARMMLDKGVDIIITAPTEETLNTLNKNIKRGIPATYPTESKDKDALLLSLLGEELYSKYKTAFSLLAEKEKGEETLSRNQKYPPENSVIFTGDLNDFDIFLTEEFKNEIKAHGETIQKIKVIFADEVSLFNPLELQIFDEFAKNNVIRFIGFGDDLQNGFNFSESKPFSISSVYYNRPPKLKIVVRGENIHQSDNASVMEIAVSNVMKRKNLGVKYNLSYYDTTVLKGAKFVNTLTLEDLNKLDKSLETIVIVKEKISEEEKAILEKSGIVYRVIKSDQVQSREFDQVIILHAAPEGERLEFTELVELNTLLGRAKHASLIVGENQFLQGRGMFRSVQKPTYSTISFKSDKINPLIEKRLELIKEAIGEYKDGLKMKTETTVVKDTIIPAEEDTGDEDPITKSPSKDHDGDNKFMLYSFYNVLNAEVDGDTVKIDPQEDSNVFDNMQILLDTGFKIDSKVVDDFIKLKNAILYKQAKKIADIDKVLEIGNVFRGTFAKTKTGKLIVKNYTFNGKSIDTYGKQAHIVPPKHEEKPFLVYQTELDNGKIWNIVLGALPDTNNINWDQPINKKFLDSLNEGSDITATIKEYSGLRFIYRSGTTKKGENEKPIEITGNSYQDFIKNLKKINPGINISSATLRVFGGNSAKIKTFVESFGYKGSIKKYDSLKGRPFLEISYVDANSKENTRIIVLNPITRNLSEAKKEYLELEKLHNKAIDIEEKKKIATKFTSLVDRLNGARLLNFIQNNLSENTQAEIKKRILNPVLMYWDSKGSPETVTRLWEKMFSITKKTDWTLEEKEFITFPKEGDIRLHNLGLRLLMVLTDSDIAEINNANKGEYQLFYNSKLGSSHTEKSDILELENKDDIRHYKISSFIEPPVFMIDIKQKKTKENPTVVKPKPVSKSTETPKFEWITFVKSNPNFESLANSVGVTKDSLITALEEKFSTLFSALKNHLDTLVYPGLSSTEIAVWKQTMLDWNKVVIERALSNDTLLTESLNSLVLDDEILTDLFSNNNYRPWVGKDKNIKKPEKISDSYIDIYTILGQDKQLLNIKCS